MDPEFAATVPHLHHRARNQVSVQAEPKNAVKPVSVNDRAARVGRTALALAVLAAVFYFGFILMMAVSS